MELTVKNKKLTIRDLCLTGIFAAITAVLAQISIPMPYGVPITLQTFAIPLAAIALGPFRGTLSAFVYVTLGAFGIPVFAEFSGGFGIVFGVTGGFILSFPILALFSGTGAGIYIQNSIKNKLFTALGLAGGLALNFLCGMLMFAAVMPCSIKTAFLTCALPFLPTEIIKMVLAGAAGLKLRKILQKSGILP